MNLSQGIKKAWRGEERLAKVFWVYGALLGAAIKIGGGGITLLVFSASKEAGVVVGLIFATIYVIYAVWVLVSIWRSAANTSPKFWGYVAKLYIIILISVFIVHSLNN